MLSNGKFGINVGRTIVSLERYWPGGTEEILEKAVFRLKFEPRTYRIERGVVMAGSQLCGPSGQF